MGRLTNEEVEDLVQHQYEEALVDGEPWAEDAYAHRRALMTSTMGGDDVG